MDITDFDYDFTKLPIVYMPEQLTKNGTLKIPSLYLGELHRVEIKLNNRVPSQIHLVNFLAKSNELADYPFQVLAPGYIDTLVKIERKKGKQLPRSSNLEVISRIEDVYVGMDGTVRLLFNDETYLKEGAAVFGAGKSIIITSQPGLETALNTVRNIPDALKKEYAKRLSDLGISF